ncbi:hypothetical protein RIR_jg17078.t1 [Rhizophagus irregularis DAOM 181602=DAOM 197198]|nr:hypothetical protein RIR_jg17078.t1 [Rhizophagus irregularis DAOM 181602=DAOM 197198]
MEVKQKYLQLIFKKNELAYCQFLRECFTYCAGAPSEVAIYLLVKSMVNDAPEVSSVIFKTKSSLSGLIASKI